MYCKRTFLKMKQTMKDRRVAINSNIIGTFSNVNRKHTNIKLSDVEVKLMKKFFFLLFYFY